MRGAIGTSSVVDLGAVEVSPLDRAITLTKIEINHYFHAFFLAPMKVAQSETSCSVGNL